MIAANLIATAGGSFTPPGPADFDLPPVFGEVTKPMILLTLSAVFIFVLSSSTAGCATPSPATTSGPSTT